MNTPWSHTPESPRATRTPYVGPAAVVPETRAGTASAPQPYVPVELRSRPSLAAATSVSVVTQQEEELPSISDYLAAPDSNRPVLSDADVAADRTGAESGPAAFLEHSGSDTPFQPGVSGSAEAVAETGCETRSDDWPFADAGAAASELSSELPTPDLFADAVASGHAPQTLPMWNDDDMMDIMPVHSAHDSRDAQGVDAPSGFQTEADAGQGAAQEAAQGTPRQHREAAARALEGLASRVRGGELPLHGYASEMGDAAALAAALAALLGERR